MAKEPLTLKEIVERLRDSLDINEQCEKVSLPESARKTILVNSLVSIVLRARGEDDGSEVM